MKKQHTKEHRPIIINQLSGPFVDADEEKQINEIALKICEEFKRSRKVLDGLVKQYREVVGYENTDLSFEEQMECDCSTYHDDPKSWLSSAINDRKRWILEELKGETT